jgi:hypothetical protein
VQVRPHEPFAAHQSTPPVPHAGSVRIRASITRAI